MAGNIRKPLSEAFTNSPSASLLAIVLALSPPRLAGAVPKTTPSAVPSDPDVTLVLRAMNTSRERPSIDLEVAIDGQVAVRDRLSSESSSEISLPPSKTFPLKLARGKHLLKATSAEAKATLERRIDIRKKHWALLSYEPGEDGAYRFTLTVRDEPILFQ